MRAEPTNVYRLLNEFRMQIDEQRGSSVGQLLERREPMADGRRYIIYYTFGLEEEKAGETAETSSSHPNTEKEAENV